MSTTYTFLILLWLFMGADAQCSAYCKDCDNAEDAYTEDCKSCRDNWTPDGTSCLVDSDRYPLIIDIPSGLTFNDSATGNCGSLFPNPIPGVFQNNKTIEIYKNTTMDPHYQVRVIFSALFIDRWDNSDEVKLWIDGKQIADVDYDKSYSLGDKTSCGSDSNKQRYGTADTGDRGHTSSSLTIEASSNKCNCDWKGCKPCGWMIPDMIILISTCNQMCLKCTGTSNTQCQACANDTAGNQFLLSGSTCDVTCPIGEYRKSENLCGKCSVNCTECSILSTNCSACATGYIYWNNSCPKSCPDGWYKNITNNQCEQCDTPCLKCTDFPTPCTYCNDTFFLWEGACYSTCPENFLVPNSANRTCEDCNIYCVDLTVNFYQPTGQNGISSLYVDMTFTRALDFTTFPKQTFQTISFSSSQYDLSMFNVTYTIMPGNRTYRINLQPLGFMILINETISVTTMSIPTPNLYSVDGVPFKDRVYGISKSLVWTYIKPPDMTTVEYSIVSGFSSFSTEVNSGLAQPGLQEIKKLGFMLLLMNSLQITSCLLLINLVMPQNLYEGIRIFASLIFFDVPPWESESNATKLFVVPPVSSLARRRMLQTSTSLQEFRFRRTGFTNIFIFDCYVQIFVIALCYVLLIGCICLGKYSTKFKQTRRHLYSILTALHEISLMYFTLTIMFEFEYFTTTKTIRWVSMIICVLVTVYYLLYHTYRYYELMEFPLLDPECERYHELIEKNGSILRNMRHEDITLGKGCMPVRSFFKPHSYHIVSYIKKILMMLTFPLFYSNGKIALIILFIIQLGEIIRFCLTWPFAKRWRNICKLILEFILLFIFGTVYAIQQVTLVIFGSDPPPESIRLYFNLGWIGFGLIMIFNFGYFVLCIIDLSHSCRYTNKQMIQENRKTYFFEKLQNLDTNDNEMPAEAVNEYVKRGNLNHCTSQNLPNVDLRIELYEITPKSGYYKLEVNNVMEACMESQFTIAQENNVRVKRKFEGVFNVNQYSPHVFRIIDRCYNAHARPDTEKIIIKTFSLVEQKKYKRNQAINLNLNKMSQEIELQSRQQVSTKEKLGHLMPGFPIPEDLLRNLEKALAISVPRMK